MASMSTVLPPPGLEEMSSAASMKEFWPKLPESGCIVKPPGLQFDLEESTMSPQEGQTVQSHAGPWVNAVLAASPFLSPEGLHRALAIVDSAIRNAQHAKALDELVLSSEQSPYVQSASCLRAQINAEQIQLLNELQQLHLYYSEPAQADVSQLAVPVEEPVCAPVATDSVTKNPERGPEKQPGRQAQTLSTSLQLLSHENPDCLFIVRRINKLGFKASRTLKRHYSAFGAVVRVLVAHSTVRQHGNPDCHARRRPSSLGFVQMSSADSVRAILAAGIEQEVDGAFIRIQKFERQQAQMFVENDEEQVNKCADTSCIWERHTSSGSDNSVATTASSSSSTLYKESLCEQHSETGLDVDSQSE